MNKNGARDIESLLAGKFGFISGQDFCFVGLNPRQGLLAKCLGFICHLGEPFSHRWDGGGGSPCSLVNMRINAQGF